MRLTGISVALSIALAVVAARPAHATGDRIAVVTNEALEPGLTDWLAHRRGQGHDVSVLRVADPGATDQARLACAQALIKQIRKAAPRFLLIAGDASIVPPISVTIYGIGPFESDHLYGLPGARGLPTVHVGRIPARDAASLRAALRKTIRYETTFKPSEARNTVQLLLGQTLMGDGPDMLYGGLARQTAAQRLDQHYLVKVLNAWPKCRSFVPAPKFPAAVRAAFEANPLIVCYCGHGAPTAFAKIRTARRRHPMFGNDHVAGMTCAATSPLFFSICCHNGDFENAEQPGLCARMALEPGGPVAAFGASAVSYTMPNLALVRGMIATIANGPKPTLGESITAMRRFLDTHESPAMERVFEMVDGDKPLSQLKEPHQFMYHLFGDPSLRLRFPRKCVTLDADVVPGRISIRGQVPSLGSGKVFVRLCADRRRAIRSATPGESPAAAADDRTFARAGAEIRDGGFTVSFDLTAIDPAQRALLRHGALFVRVYVANATEDGVGSMRIPLADARAFATAPAR